MSPDKFLSDLSQIYPAERFLTQPAQLTPYESDALTAYRVRPLAVVLPVTQNEVIETVRLCDRYQIPFVARGSGTSLSGGSLPVEGGIVIALNRLDRILRIDPENRIAVVEAGVVNLDVSAAAQPYGLYYAPDPSSQPICTIGGNLAFNSGGAHCLKFGMTSNHVLGIKAVLPDGEVVQLGDESLEGIGPDLVGLFVGSEGLFGIALEVILRLMPKPEIFKTVLASYSSLEGAGNAVSQVVASGLLPGAMEMMDKLAIQAAEAAVQANYPPGAAADRARIWKGRKSAFSAVGRLSPDYIVQDGVVPRSRLGETLAEIERLSKQYNVRVANVFHAGDGNLHPLILYDGREAGSLERAEEIAGDVIHICIQSEGSITGEHGVGMEKRAYLPQMFNEVEMNTMRQLHNVIDPQRISNRGKMFLDIDSTSLS